MFLVPPSVNLFMATVKLKIDVSGTVGDEAWRNLRQFDEIQSAAFGPKFGSSGPCKHAASLPHVKGEWIGAEIKLETSGLLGIEIETDPRPPRGSVWKGGSQHRAFGSLHGREGRLQLLRPQRRPPKLKGTFI